MDGRGGAGASGFGEEAVDDEDDEEEREGGAAGSQGAKLPPIAGNASEVSKRKVKKKKKKKTKGPGKGDGKRSSWLSSLSSHTRVSSPRSLTPTPHKEPHLPGDHFRPKPETRQSQTEVLPLPTHTT